MAKKRPIAPPAEEKPREAQPKKRKRLFKQGDFVQNVEDESLIVVVTRNAEKGIPSFHGTVIASNRRTIGEHERFWLLDRFELANVTIQIN